MCKIVSSCIFFFWWAEWKSAGNVTFRSSQQWSLQSQKASNLRDVRTSSASNTTLHYKVNSINAPYMLKLTIKWEEKDAKNEGQWSIESDPSWAACVARRVHSRKRLEYQRKDQAAKSAETSVGRHKAHTHRTLSLLSWLTLLVEHSPFHSSSGNASQWAVWRAKTNHLELALNMKFHCYVGFSAVVKGLEDG